MMDQFNISFWFQSRYGQNRRLGNWKIKKQKTVLHEPMLLKYVVCIAFVSVYVQGSVTTFYLTYLNLCTIFNCCWCRIDYFRNKWICHWIYICIILLHFVKGNDWLVWKEMSKSSPMAPIWQHDKVYNSLIQQ